MKSAITCIFFLARPAGFEPAAYGFEGQKLKAWFLLKF
jgi:hypothetical protein